MIDTYTYDPTRTTTLRNAFSRDAKKRFNELTRIIRRGVVDEDCFGLFDDTLPIQTMQYYQMNSPGHKAFDFHRSQRKVSEFMAWLQYQINDGILQVTNIARVGESVDMAWTNIYIHDSYKRGLIRAHQELRKAGYNPLVIDTDVEWENYMRQPFHADRLGLLYTRVFQDLKGITDNMSMQISRVLTQGMADGDNPRLLAKKLNAVITKGGGELGITDTLGRYIPARRRAELLARTEIIRSHHKATMQEYHNWSVEGVELQAEFITAGDDRVCPICSGMNGNHYSLQEAENIIPVHPLCRCIVLPLRKSKK